MSRPDPRINWDAIAAARSVQVGRWHGSGYQHEDTLRCPKCGGGVLVLGWMNTGIAYCEHMGRHHLVKMWPATCDWSAPVEWVGDAAVLR